MNKINSSLHEINADGFIDLLFDLHIRLRENESSADILGSTNESKRKINAMIYLLKEIGEFRAENAEEMFSQYVKFSRSLNLKNTRKETYIACLSQTIDSTLMWAHYADFHRGFALEYDRSLLKESQQRNKVHLFPVAYGDERYDATQHEIDMLKVRFEHGSNFPLTDELSCVKANIHKGSDWRYEREWRLISLPPNPDGLSISIKPKAIYLGSQISVNNKEIILKSIEGKDMDIYEMRVDKDERKCALSYNEYKKLS
jgi:hypothetical protein